MKTLGPYIPILRTKTGELQALKELAKTTIGKINPFFDFHRPSLAKRKKKEPFNKHIEDTCRKLIRHWPVEQLLFFDLYFIDLKERMNDSIHPLTWVCQFLRKNGYNFIPTIGTERDKDYACSLRNEVQEGLENGVCIRLLNDDLETPGETFQEVQKTLNYLRISDAECHLLVDFKYIETSGIELAIKSLIKLRNYIDFSNWKSLIISGSGFPKDMSGVPSDTTVKIPRTELELWKLAVQLKHLLGARPLYSDYCIVHPEIPDVDPVIMRAVGKIRYTTERNWVVFRGHSFQKNDGYKQYFKLAKKVVDHECYLGSEAGWGDNQYRECSKGNKYDLWELNNLDYSRYKSSPYNSDRTNLQSCRFLRQLFT